MAQDSKGSFYEGTKINDIGSAQILANTEAEKGRNAALVQEPKLKKEFDTGLTELQQKNLDTIQAIQGKYPNALEEHVSGGGDTFYGFRKPGTTYERVYKELGVDDMRANVLLSQHGIAISDSRYEAFEFIDQATKTEDLQTLQKKLENNPNSADLSIHLNCKADISDLSGQWKTILSTNLKAFDAANRGMAVELQDKVSPAVSFVDSL